MKAPLASCSGAEAQQRGLAIVEWPREGFSVCGGCLGVQARMRCEASWRATRPWTCTSESEEVLLSSWVFTTLPTRPLMTIDCKMLLG